MPVTILELHPSQIRFSQDSISYKFQDRNGVEGGDCNDLVNGILHGKITIEDIPNIRVAVINNLYVTYDNRRLYVFRAVQYHKEHLIIEVKLIQPDRFHETNRLTSENSGKEVCVRYNRSINRARERCRTLPHYRDSWFVSEPMRLHSDVESSQHGTMSVENQSNRPQSSSDVQYHPSVAPARSSLNDNHILHQNYENHWTHSEVDRYNNQNEKKSKYSPTPMAAFVICRMVCRIIMVVNQQLRRKILRRSIIEEAKRRKHKFCAIS